MDLGCIVHQIKKLNQQIRRGEMIKKILGILALLVIVLLIPFTITVLYEVADRLDRMGIRTQVRGVWSCFKQRI
jgi:hypothetical protein